MSLPLRRFPYVPPPRATLCEYTANDAEAHRDLIVSMLGQVAYFARGHRLSWVCRGPLGMPMHAVSREKLKRPTRFRWTGFSVSRGRSRSDGVAMGRALSPRGLLRGFGVFVSFMVDRGAFGLHGGAEGVGGSSW